MCPLSVILPMHVTVGSVTLTLNEIINRSTSTVISLYHGYGSCHRKSNTVKDGPITNFNKSPSFEKLSMGYQASTPVQLRPSLLWDATQRRLAAGHRRFGTNCWNHLQASSCPRRTGGTGGRVNGRRCERWPVLSEIRKLDYFALEDGCDTFSRNIGNQPPLSPLSV